jgi:hypothetical protein
MIEARAEQPPRWIFVSMAIGAYAALVAVMPAAKWAAVLIAPLLLAYLAWWTLARPHRWIGAFIATAMLLPPFPIPLGDSGPHPSLIFAALGISLACSIPPLAHRRGPGHARSCACSPCWPRASHLRHSNPAR